MWAVDFLNTSLQWWMRMRLSRRKVPLQIEDSVASRWWIKPFVMLLACASPLLSRATIFCSRTPWNTSHYAGGTTSMALGITKPWLATSKLSYPQCIVVHGKANMGLLSLSTTRALFFIQRLKYLLVSIRSFLLGRAASLNQGERPVEPIWRCSLYQCPSTPRPLVCTSKNQTVAKLFRNMGSWWWSWWYW